MPWIPLPPPLAGAPPPGGPPSGASTIQDTRVSNQEIDVTFAGNLNLSPIFTGSVTATDVGYWLDAMAYSDRFDQTPGPTGVIVANRFGFGLRVLFRVRRLSPKASLNYGLIGASVDAGFAQASYQVIALGFGSQANQALAQILDGMASFGTSLTGDTFYKLNSSILKNLVAYMTANLAAMQPVPVASLVETTIASDSLDASHAVLFAMRQIRSGKSLNDALASAGDLDSTTIRLAYMKIMADAPASQVPSEANKNAADQWLADD